MSPAITDAEAVRDNAMRAAEGVTDIEVTRAVRDAHVFGVEVERGQYMALCAGEISSLGRTADEALLAALERVDTDEAELLTLFVGADATDEQRCSLTEIIEQRYPDLELTVYDGGQALYDYLLAIE